MITTLVETLAAYAAEVERDRRLMRWLHRDESQREVREELRLQALEIEEQREREPRPRWERA